MNFLLLAAATAWSAWLGCLVFSNLWIIRPLWISPGVAALAGLFFCGTDLRVWRRGALWVCSGAVAVSCALWAAGLVWAAQQPVTLKRAADDAVVLLKTLSATHPTKDGPAVAARLREVWVVPDAAVFGESYGQELRRWSLAASGPQLLKVYRRVREVPSTVGSQVTGILLCGAAASEVGDLATTDFGTQVWLLHPTSAPPQTVPPAWAKGSRVLLPGIDITGEGAGWWVWAAQAEPLLPVQLSSNLAIDVRPRWPSLVSELGGQESAPRGTEGESL